MSTSKPSVIGRLNNVISRRLGRQARAFGRFHSRVNGTPLGKLLDLYFGAPTFTLTVTGRKTGEPRTVTLILTRRGDEVVVGGSNAGNPKLPAWYLNLRTAGVASVTVGKQTWPVRFREVTGPERDECWALLNKAYRHFDTYQQLTDRTIPVAVLERA